MGKQYASKIAKGTKNVEYYLNDIKLNKNSLFLTPVNEHELTRVIEKLLNKTSSGWDGISNKLVKCLKSQLVIPLSTCINRSFMEGRYPDCLKLAHVNPLFKSGKRNIITNYRPISLLPVLSKLFEKCMYTRIYSFLSKNRQLYSSQYGFRQRHSCENAIQELLSGVLKGIENRKHTAAVYLDLSKAFDTLDHSILIMKLERYGIRGIALDWFKSYLNKRSLSVRCAAGEPISMELSENYTFHYGVPQGSCLGPLLFLIYCNDLPNVLEACNCILFADDTTLYKSHENLRYLKWLVQQDRHQLLDWFSVNKLTLNLSKSVCMLFPKDHKVVKLELDVNGMSIPEVENTKFLGVWIDKNLRWDTHVNNLILKLKRNRHLLRTSQNFLNVQAKKIIYFSHVQSHVTYCLWIWGNMINRAHITRLDKVLLDCLSHVKKNEQRETLEILGIEHLIELENCKFRFKLLNEILPEKVMQCVKTDSVGNSLAKMHRYKTRKKNTLNVPVVKNSKYLNSILCKGPKVYGNLPLSLKAITNYNTFISRCKKVLLNRVM